jgi:hypothetical protein
MMKVLKKLVDRTHLNIIKANHSQHTEWGKTEGISSKIRNKMSVLLSPLLFNVVLEFLEQ